MPHIVQVLMALLNFALGFRVVKIPQARSYDKKSSKANIF